MLDVNQVTLVGRLGADPELRTTKNGRAVANFSLATSRPVRTQEGWDRVTDWHRCEVWEKQAEWVASHLKKGDPAAVSGSVRYSSWMDERGQKRSSTRIHARTVSFLARRVEGAELPPASVVEEREPPY